ncbi:MAG: pyridoxamine 5'-phosphate oxidase family protein [Deltaproteobacteria bacterium]|nr:pyridoxamine 5'-phosphate oxidase family protein [Deltaproteobacteria bacterium]
MKHATASALIIFLAALLISPGASGAAADAQKKDQPQKAKQIEATAGIADKHPEIEPGMSCNDCHEVKLDANTSATQVWLKGDYLKWQAGEGVMTKDQVWDRIMNIFKTKNMKATFVMATCLNNRPYTYTADFALDPAKKVLYAFHEKGTEKLAHIKNNPHISMNWHREFDDNFANVACFQVLGKAEIFDGATPEFDEGLKVYPYEYAAKARKMTIEQWREVVKKSMIMTRTTIDRIRLTEGALAPLNFRTSQEWTR